MFIVIAVFIFGIPVAGRWWFGSYHRWQDYVLVGIGILLASGILQFMLGPLTPPSRGLLTLRRLLVLAIAVAAVIMTVRWRGGHPGIWEVVAIGTGIMVIPFEIDLTRRHGLSRSTEASQQLRQLLAIDLLQLLDIVYDASQEGSPPPLRWPMQLRPARASLRWLIGSPMSGGEAAATCGAGFMNSEAAWPLAFVGTNAQLFSRPLTPRPLCLHRSAMGWPLSLHATGSG